MKKLRNTLLLILSLILILTSCEKENDDPPSLSLKTTEGYTYDETMVAIGDSVKIGILAESNGEHNITNIQIKVNDEIVYDEGVNVEKVEMDFHITKGIADEELWELSVRDKNGNSSSVSILLTKDPDSGFKPILTYPSIILGAQDHSSIGGFLSFIDNSINDLTNAFGKQSTIDLIYYYYGNDENVIGSPGANIEEDVFNNSSEAPDVWEVKRTTRFLKTSLSTSEYESFVNDSILISSYNEASAKRKAKNLAINDIYSFKNEDGRFGMFLVKSISGEKEGIIEISVKIQE